MSGDRRPSFDGLTLLKEGLKDHPSVKFWEEMTILSHFPGVYEILQRIAKRTDAAIIVVFQLYCLYVYYWTRRQRLQFPNRYDPILSMYLSVILGMSGCGKSSCFLFFQRKVMGRTMFYIQEFLESTGLDPTYDPDIQRVSNKDKQKKTSSSSESMDSLINEFMSSTDESNNDSSSMSDSTNKVCDWEDQFVSMVENNDGPLPSYGTRSNYVEVEGDRDKALMNNVKKNGGSGVWIAAEASKTFDQMGKEGPRIARNNMIDLTDPEVRGTHFSTAECVDTFTVGGVGMAFGGTLDFSRFFLSENDSDAGLAARTQLSFSYPTEESVYDKCLRATRARRENDPVIMQLACVVAWHFFLLWRMSNFIQNPLNQKWMFRSDKDNTKIIWETEESDYLAFENLSSKLSSSSSETNSSTLDTSKLKKSAWDVLVEIDEYKKKRELSADFVNRTEIHSFGIAQRLVNAERVSHLKVREEPIWEEKYILDYECTRIGFVIQKNFSDFAIDLASRLKTNPNITSKNQKNTTRKRRRTDVRSQDWEFVVETLLLVLKEGNGSGEPKEVSRLVHNSSTRRKGIVETATKAVEKVVDEFVEKGFLKHDKDKLVVIEKESLKDFQAVSKMFTEYGTDLNSFYQLLENKKDLENVKELENENDLDMKVDEDRGMM